MHDHVLCVHQLFSVLCSIYDNLSTHYVHRMRYWHPRPFTSSPVFLTFAALPIIAAATAEHDAAEQSQDPLRQIFVNRRHQYASHDHPPEAVTLYSCNADHSSPTNDDLLVAGMWFGNRSAPSLVPCVSYLPHAVESRRACPSLALVGHKTHLCSSTATLTLPFTAPVHLTLLYQFPCDVS